MKRKRLLMLIGSVCLALMLALPLVASCGPAAPEEAAEEIAALESKLAAEKAKTEAAEGKVSGLEAEIAALKAPGEVYHWRLQHNFGAAENYLFEQYADIVREMSGGRIDIDVYCSGELVPFFEVMDALAKGTIDMAYDAVSTWTGEIPETAVLEIPFEFRDADDCLAIMLQLGMLDYWRELFDERLDVRIVGTALSDYGLYTWTDPFSCLADLKGRRASYIYEFDAYLFEKIGVAATWIDPEVLYTSLATGVIDGTGWGGIQCQSMMGLLDFAKYGTLPYYLPTYAAIYCMGNDLWHSLPADPQAILEQASLANGAYMRSHYVSVEQASRLAAEEEGFELITLPEEDVEFLYDTMEEFVEMKAAESPEMAEAANVLLEGLRHLGILE